MRIIKGSEAIPVEHPIFCIVGQPGICKTSLAYSTHDPLLLDFDQGAYRAVNRRNTLQIAKWADVDELMAKPEELEPYRTLVVDTVGRCLDMMTVDIIAKDAKKGSGGNLNQQGWGVLKTRFRGWMTQVRSLGKDVLLVAHDKEDKDGDSRIVRADIVGGSYGEIMKVSDFVGYLYMAGRDRVLDFNPTDRWVGKNPARWDPFVVPAPAKATTFLAGLFDKGREALGLISEESAKVMLLLAEWQTRVENLSGADEINAVIPESQKLSPILAPQVKRLIADRAKALGFKFESGKYVAPVAA